jgi:hypothetical protein
MDTVLYHRDPLLCLQHLMQNPLVQDQISFSPFKLYESAAKVMRVYTEWLSGDRAWDMQVGCFVSTLPLSFVNEEIFCVDKTWSRGDATWCNIVL